MLCSLNCIAEVGLGEHDNEPLGFMKRRKLLNHPGAYQLLKRGLQKISLSSFRFPRYIPSKFYVHGFPKFELHAEALLGTTKQRRVDSTQ